MSRRRLWIVIEETESVAVFHDPTGLNIRK